MTKKVMKYGLMTIAAVLLVAMAFAGAASALDPYTDSTVKLWVNESTDTGFHFHLNESKPVNEVKAIYNSSANVYKITSLDDLENIGSGSDIYILMQDIYCTTPKTSAIINTFTGTLIGNGYTIYNLTINSTSEKIGLVGTLGTNGTLNYVNLSCANISSGNYYVGGLVGYIDSACNLTGCTVMHSDVTICNGKKGNVGGLVGRAGSTDLKIQNCSVENSSISSGGYNAGGLAGWTGFGSFSGCSVMNCTVSGGYNAGGLVGTASDMGRRAGTVSSANGMFSCCYVKNCMVFSFSSEAAGGLAGYTMYANYSGCSTMNCTVAGHYYVGGLIGLVSDNKYASLSGCMAKDCAVAGNMDTVYDLVGRGSMSGSPIADNVSVDKQWSSRGKFISIWNGTTHVFARDILSLELDPLSFFKVPGASYYSNGTDVNIKYTKLGAYGTENGFGYYKPTTYTVMYDGNGNESGSVPVVADLHVVDRTVTVLGNSGNLAKPGYNFTGWNMNSVSGALKQTGDTFQCTANTNFYANWTVNVTNFRYVNETDVEIPGISSTLVTYNEIVPSVSFTTPIRVGYTFAGWNVSGTDTRLFNETGVPQVVSNYINESKYWVNMSLENGSMLTLETSWTAYAYNVTFNNNTGSGIMENQTLTYNDLASLKPNIFTKSGFTFSGWNKTSTNGTAVDFADKASVKNLTAEQNGNVALYAVWTETPAQYTPSSSKQTGYTVILPEEQSAPTTNATVILTPTPTVIPTTQPTTTSKSPAPVVGIIAGLGVAAVLLRLRK